MIIKKLSNKMDINEIFIGCQMLLDICNNSKQLTTDLKHEFFGKLLDCGLFDILAEILEEKKFHKEKNNSEDQN